ncbi:enoyl-CoA hydratase/isomerase family protein [Mycobacterium intracellulare 1956]|uniref:Enoyl-CoA hydratase/isomerase family protein n=1 Tax=Mycobacterium intracellulare 1956 TaxID=1299331 RepID=X8CIN3_MYCIT|nr:enoyl-CoA hydratase/isomerase family protein [Mycobacterium intracellulare 1956]
MPTTLELDRPGDGVAVLRLNRPQRLNAINETMQTELRGLLGDLAVDATVRAVVLTGAGRGFCAGIDVRDFGPSMLEASAPALERMRFQERMAALAEAVRALPQPVIAAVNGPCVGAASRCAWPRTSESARPPPLSATPPSCWGSPAPRWA